MVPRAKHGKVLAANQILDSTWQMIRADNGSSKLCACATRHATRHRPSDGAVAQLGKGRCFAPPRCIPSRMPQAATETVPVSAPFGFAGVAAFRSWGVRP